MKIESGLSSVSNPIDSSIITVEMATKKSTMHPSGLSLNLEDYNATLISKSSKPDLVHPSDLQEMKKPNLSMQNLLVNAFRQSEESQKNYINYLYEKQSKLTQYMMQEKKKVIEFHKNSDSTMSLWQPTIDIVLPFCTSIIALYLGFSPVYSLSKIPAICTSLIGFAIAGLKMAGIEIPNYIPGCYMAIFNLYMAYMNPENIVIYITTFLQTLPIISEFAYSIDNNSIASDEALAKKAIQLIDRDLKNVTLEISRAMKMIAEKRKFFPITTEYIQLQNQIAAIGTV